MAQLRSYSLCRHPHPSPKGAFLKGEGPRRPRHRHRRRHVQVSERRGQQESRPQIAVLSPQNKWRNFDWVLALVLCFQRMTHAAPRPSLPGLTRQSILPKDVDARDKPGHDGGTIRWSQHTSS
jgi:hypothetical protein